jgi:alpha-beta hydrolase superfamily lysophospholipase
MPPHRRSFTVALTCISRVLILRDRVLGWTGPGRRGHAPDLLTSTHSIQSGNSLLDAVFVAPALVPAQAAVLLCHGIGETVDHWFPVQRLLALNGVASLLFDFSGYGKSTGRVDWSQFEDDAVSAFECMQRLAPTLPHSILGFSLGSGIAAAVVNRIAARQLVLCSAFTSFRDAARFVGVPARLSHLVPPIWDAEESLRGCVLPVLVVHGEKDRLFPVRMAHKLISHCGPDAELIIVPNVAHNQPFRKPHLSYWGPIISWLGK